MQKCVYEIPAGSHCHDDRAAVDVGHRDHKLDSSPGRQQAEFFRSQSRKETTDGQMRCSEPEGSIESRYRAEKVQGAVVPLFSMVR